MFLPEDQIIRQGEDGMDMYFISTGDCVVTVRDTQRNETTVRLLGRGNFFGVILYKHNENVLGNCSLHTMQKNGLR